MSADSKAHDGRVKELLQVAESAYEETDGALRALGREVPEGSVESGWTYRQVLSHVVGAWHRVPVHAAFFLEGKPLPLVIGDDYCIGEWEPASVLALRTSLNAGYACSVASLQGLEPGDLDAVSATPFGEASLGEFLMLSFERHIRQYHAPQLEPMAARPKHH